MATLSEWQAHLSRLQEARASGTRRVRDASGDEIEYRSDAELARALAWCERETAKITGTAPARRFITVNYDRGLD